MSGNVTPQHAFLLGKAMYELDVAKADLDATLKEIWSGTDGPPSTPKAVDALRSGAAALRNAVRELRRRPELPENVAEAPA